MDPAHFLAARSLADPSDTDTRPAPPETVDVFYAAHGHEVFVRAFRLRRWLGSLSSRRGETGQPTRGFASLAAPR